MKRGTALFPDSPLKPWVLGPAKSMEGGFFMTKAELVAVMAKEAGVPKAVAVKALEAFMGTVADELKKNNRIGLVGFGTFSVVKRKARTGRNPRTVRKSRSRQKRPSSSNPEKILPRRSDRECA
jgi:DNA-binding protein HU-beta